MHRHSYGSMQFRSCDHPRQDYHTPRPGEAARMAPLPPAAHDDLVFAISEAQANYVRAQERAQGRRVAGSLALIALVLGSVLAGAAAWASVLR